MLYDCQIAALFYQMEQFLSIDLASWVLSYRAWMQTKKRTGDWVRWYLQRKWRLALRCKFQAKEDYQHILHKIGWNPVKARNILNQWWVLAFTRASMWLQSLSNCRWNVQKPSISLAGWSNTQSILMELSKGRFFDIISLTSSSSLYCNLNDHTEFQ